MISELEVKMLKPNIFSHEAIINEFCLENLKANVARKLLNWGEKSNISYLRHVCRELKEKTSWSFQPAQWLSSAIPHNSGCCLYRGSEERGNGVGRNRVSFSGY